MIHDHVHNQTLTAQALVIKGASGSNMIAKTGAAATLHKVDGKIFSIAASTDVFGAATDTSLDLATGYKAMYAVIATVNAAGTGFTYSVRKGTSVATSAVLKVSEQLQPHEAGKVVIGYVLVSNATGSNFAYGTTPLDTASLTVSYLAPNAIIGR